MSVRKKINFFELYVENSDKIEHRDYVHFLFKHIKEAIDKNDNFVDISLSSGDVLQFRLDSSMSDRTVVIRGKARLIKFDQFQDTYNVRSHEERSLAEDTDEDEGLTEETHFVIDLRYKRPIMGLETSQGGPRHGNILYYMERWSDKIKLHQKFLLEATIGRKAEEFVNSINECASLLVKVKREKIPNITSAEKGLGTMLEAAQQYADTDYIELVLGYEFRVKRNDRPSTFQLIRRVKELIGIDDKQNDFFENFEVLQIRAQEGSEPLKPFDLIAEKTATEVYAEKKNPRSKHFNSQKLYDAITTEITRNFGASAISPTTPIGQIPEQPVPF